MTRTIVKEKVSPIETSTLLMKDIALKPTPSSAIHKHYQMLTPTITGYDISIGAVILV